jgi:3-hydroxybutyryl-CoA dehydrogenase
MGIEWIKRVLVVGAGTMGHGIATVFGLHGYDVDLTDLSGEALDRGLRVIRADLETMKQQKLIGPRQIAGALGRIHPASSLAAARNADIVAEAVSENPHVKRALFLELDRLCPPRTILTSTTSYLNVFPFLKTPRREKVVIAHWWAPPHLIPLVDVVGGPKTSPGVVETVNQLLIRLGKKPVVMKRFVPGFIVNRLQRAMAREIFYLLDGGYATPEDIDTAVKNSIGMRIPVIGVVQRYDFAGLDLAWSFETNPSIHLVSRDRRPGTLRHLVRKGCLGVKSGRGFYDYSDQTTEEVTRERDRKLIALMKFLESRTMTEKK